jgi:hypothetical protein
MDTTADRADLIELLALYADISDQKDYTDRPRRTFTDPITIDFQSVADVPLMTVSLADYLQNLRQSFEPFAATHHAITGHVVEIDGDRAKIHAHVRAEHWGESPNYWLVVGFYDNEAVRTVDGWRLDRVKLTATHQESRG